MDRQRLAGPALYQGPLRLRSEPALSWSKGQANFSRAGRALPQVQSPFRDDIREPSAFSAGQALH